MTDARRQWGVFHPGRQHAALTARALHDLGRLAWFGTGIADRPGSLPHAIVHRLPGRVGKTLQRELTRFACPLLPSDKIVTAGWHEWAERVAARAGLRRVARQIDARGNAAFGAALVRALDGDLPAGLWGYNGSSRSLFSHPAAAGSRKVLDRTIGDWRAWNAVLEQLRRACPSWLLPTDRPVSNSQIAKDDEEYALADRIVCGSPFVAQTIRANSPVPGISARLEIVPYCFDPALFGPPAPHRDLDRAAPVRFLFVGHLSARKGVHHVLEAIAALSPARASLTLVGEMAVPAAAFAPFAGRVTWHRAVPRARVPAIMAAHDVLLLPSYFEGSAITLLEALASGLAIVQTPQAGLGVDEASGIVIARPDTALLVAAMERLMTDRTLLARMQRQAAARAQDFTLHRYREGIAAMLAGLNA